jgi:hypothetical protein
MSNLAVAFLVRVTIVDVAPPAIASGRRVCSLVRGGQASFCTSWEFRGSRSCAANQTRMVPVQQAGGRESPPSSSFGVSGMSSNPTAGRGELDPPSARTYRQCFVEPGGAA